MENVETSKNISRQRRWQLKQKDAGRCQLCGRMAAPRKKDGLPGAFCRQHRDYIYRLAKERKARPA